MEIIESPYLVSLEDAGGVPTEHCMHAETRYCAALEKALGGPENVVSAFRAYEAAAEGDGELSGEIQSLAKAWTVASGLAQQAGMRDIGEDTGAYFDVRMV